MNQDTTSREIRNARLLKYSRERVFDAFSDPAALAKWWGPKGFTNTFHTFDFKPGGQWHFTMHSPDGQNFKNENYFKEIFRPSEISIEHILPPKFVLEISLTEKPDGTLLSWVQRFETPEMRDKIAKFAANANEENLDRLEALLSKL